MISLEDKRKIFWLKYDEDLSQRAICKRIKKNRRTIKRVIDEVELKITELSISRDQILAHENQLVTQGIYPTANRKRYRMSDAFYSELCHELVLSQNAIAAGRKSEAKKISEIHAELYKKYNSGTVEESSAYKLAHQLKKGKLD